MQSVEWAETAVTRGCGASCRGDWVIWGVFLIVLFVMITGNTVSFWLGFLVGLAIPYYIIPHYFCGRN